MPSTPEPSPTPKALADLTTLRVGGVPHRLVVATTEFALLRAVAEADAAGRPLLVLGGGSNVVCGEDLSDLVVVRSAETTLKGVAAPDGNGRWFVASAGLPLDVLAASAAEEDVVGFECLTGIPGTVGATVVQNVGAYGHEVSELIAQVRAYDRDKGEVVTLTPAELGFGYRDSILKQSMKERGGYTPRWVVVSVAFKIEKSELSAPINYPDLAEALGVDVGERAPLMKVRRAVWRVRQAKGLVLDRADHDTWSAGSFFTNPILCAEHAAALPADAPRFPAGTAPEGYDLVKTSAAWLMSHAGIERGAGLVPGPDGQMTLAPAVLNPRVSATTSTKHVLALTNRGGATATDIMALAGAIVQRVYDTYRVTLTPEPTLVGTALPG
ncbi:MAG: UDP-N-acetylmuramate dehydrogenase [Bifidobacteriaceae bacterium]|nr:UDP-N-acetylmuramate dehydrogenase [Bifidobacteriaceae bacterium]